MLKHSHNLKRLNYVNLSVTIKELHDFIVQLFLPPYPLLIKKAGQRLRILPRERTGHSKHLFPTTQEKTLHMDITRWSIPKSD